MPKWTQFALAAVALADISVYKTSFSTRSEYASVQRLSGDSSACKRSWRKKKSVGVLVKGGEADCALSTPVEGDSKQPDHTIKATAVVTKNTDKKVREDVYVGVAVRASGRGGYELRVFPKVRRTGRGLEVLVRVRNRLAARHRLVIETR